MAGKVGHYDDSQGATLTLQQLHRFWCSFTRNGPDECWPWIATIRKREGADKDILYGSFSIQGKNFLAHRVMYQLEYGSTALCVLHHCDFGLCVNPKHLFEGTRGDNNRDMAEKGRHVCWRRHLSDRQADQVRDMKDMMPQLELANHFHVSQLVIESILQGRTYRKG